MDSKREECRKYFEKNGIMDTLTKILTNLYEQNEKPNDALEHFKESLLDSSPLKMELDMARDSIKNLNETVKLLQSEKCALERQLKKYQVEFPSDKSKE